MHVHDPVVPPIVPYCAEQWSAPSLPSLIFSEEAVQALAVSQPLPSYPDLQVHVHDPALPPTVPPNMQ